MELSLVVNIHRERELLSPTMESLRRAVENFKEQTELSIEVVVVADLCDPITLSIAKATLDDFSCETRLIVVEVGDLGMSRNKGIQSSRGEWIVFADGDDLVSTNYITAMYLSFMRFGKESFVFHHPAIIDAFGDRPHLFRPLRSEKLGVFPQLIRHHYMSRLAGLRDHFMALQFRAKIELGSTRYEDWDFVIRAQVNGSRIECVESACLFYRVRRDGIMGSSAVQHQRRLRLDGSSFELEKLFSWLGSGAVIQHTLPSSSFTDPNRMVDFWKEATELERLVGRSGSALGKNFQHPREQDFWRGLDSAALLAKMSGVEHLIFADRPTNGGGELHINEAISELSLHNGASRLDGLWVAMEVGESFSSDAQDVLELGPEDGEGAAETLVRALALMPIRIRGNLHVKPGPWTHLVLEKLKEIDTSNFSIYYYAWMDARSSGLSSKWALQTQRFFDHGFDLARDLGATIVTDNKPFAKRLSSASQLAEPAPIPIERSTADFLEREPIARGIDLFWVGRIAPQKRPELLWRIAKEISDEFGTIKVFGPLEHSKKSLANKRGLQYFGPLERFQSVTSHCNPGLMIYTSWFDGMPNVILEALSSGIPVVVPDIFPLGDTFRELGLEDMLVTCIGNDKVDSEEYAKKIRWILTQRSGFLDEISDRCLASMKKREERIASEKQLFLSKLSSGKVIRLSSIERLALIHLKEQIEHLRAEEVDAILFKGPERKSVKYFLMEAGRKVFKAVEAFALNQTQNLSTRTLIKFLRPAYLRLASFFDRWANRLDG